MKKLLVLLMVLGMASFASADLIFTVDGAPQPDEIVLAPSETIELDLHLADGQNVLRYQLMYELTNEQAEFLIDGTTFPWQSVAPGKINDWDKDGNIISWVEIAADNLFSAGSGPLDLMQGLLIHCLDETPVDLIITVSNPTVINGEEIPIGTVVHTMHIEQPEPMTIALLGLGGLFLRRRK